MIVVTNKVAGISYLKNKSPLLICFIPPDGHLSHVLERIESSGIKKKKKKRNDQQVAIPQVAT